MEERNLRSACGRRERQRKRRAVPLGDVDSMKRTSSGARRTKET